MFNHSDSNMLFNDCILYSTMDILTMALRKALKSIKKVFTTYLKYSLIYDECSSLFIVINRFELKQYILILGEI